LRTGTEIEEVSAVEYPFKLIMSLNKTEYKLGELITIDLKLINIGNSTVTLLFLNRSPPEWLRFKVYNVSDDLVYEIHFYVLATTTWVYIDSGSHIDQTREWTQDCNCPHVPPREPRPIQPGTYKFVGLLCSHSLLGATLETPPILISIS
jgi:hypothetical protein